MMETRLDNPPGRLKIFVGAAMTAIAAIFCFFAIIGVFGLRSAIVALLSFIGLSIACARLRQS